MNRYKTNAAVLAREMMKKHGKVVREQRIAMQRVVKALAEDTKSNLLARTQQHSKLLVKSITGVVKVKMTKATVIGLVGAKRRVKKVVVRGKRLKIVVKSGVPSASRYFHLVENGHKTKHGRTRSFNVLQDAFNADKRMIETELIAATNRGVQMS